LLKEALLPFLKTGTMATCFHLVGKYCWDRLRLKICFKTGMKISEQPLITKLGIPSSPTALEGLRRLRALQISNSEMEANDRNSEDRTIIIIIIIIIIIMFSELKEGCCNGLNSTAYVANKDRIEMPIKNLVKYVTWDWETDRSSHTIRR
jgi:hypothetical protein